MARKPKEDVTKNWEKRLKVRRARRRFVLVLICIILCGIVIYNNRDWFLVTDSTVDRIQAGLPEQNGSDTAQPVASQPVSTAESKDEKRERQAGSLVLSDIKCEIADRDDLRIILNVEIFFNNDALCQEALFKREDLKVMVMNVMRHKEYGAIRTDSLRAELLEALNKVLEAGDLQKLVIRDFLVE
ncbi:MAG: hypothetical protein ACLFQB_05970 [Chitinispirillaceae bacterium]